MSDSVDPSDGDGWRRSREWGLAEVWEVYKALNQQHFLFFNYSFIVFGYGRT